MAPKKKKEYAALWRAAVNKVDLSNAVIKLIKEDSKFEFRQWRKKKKRHKLDISINKWDNKIETIREAWHNPKTTTAARFYILASRFGSVDNIARQIPGLKTNHNVLFVSLVNSKANGKYFRLERLDREDKFGNPLVFKPNKQMEVTMKYYQPPAPVNPQLLQSVRLGDVRQQNLDLFMEEVCSFILAMTDMIATCKLIHDPKKIWYDPGNETDEQWKDSSTPDLNQIDFNRFDRYDRDLNHMMGQWFNFKPILEKLGVDTTEFDHALDELKYATEHFSDFASEDYMDALYGVHELGDVVIEAGHQLVVDLQNKATDEKLVNSVRKNMQIPKFTTYNADKVAQHRTELGDAVSKIKETAQKTSKMKYSWDEE